MHEAEGHIVTIELKSGETYRGKLLEVKHFMHPFVTFQAEDNMNAQLQEVTFTARDGRVGKVCRSGTFFSSLNSIYYPI